MSKVRNSLAVLTVIFATSLFALPQAEAVYANTTVVCANGGGQQRSYQISWDNSNSFFAGKGYIPAFYCTGGYTSNGYDFYISDSLSDTSLGYYNGVTPEPEPIVSPSPEPSPLPSPSPSASESPTVTPDTPTATSSSSPGTGDTTTDTSDTATATGNSDTSTATSETTTAVVEPTQTSPTPSVPVEPIVTPQIPPVVEPEPIVEPETPLPSEPEPKPEPQPAEPETPEEIPIVEPQPEPELPPEPAPKPQEHEKSVTLDNGVVLTQEQAIAVALLQNPAELLATMFTDPSAALAAFGQVGADMSPEVREKSEKIVISAIIAGGIATQAAAGAAASATYRRKP